MRTILTMVAVSALVAFAMFAQAPPGGGKGKGGPPKNLKFFTADNWATAGRPAMDAFVAGLGLADKGGCGYCHVADKSSDENPKKDMARMMLNMVKDINSKFTDGKQHVTCFTCHRGDPAPKMAP
jgi:photosynthetic reaction center cytochrome c subunit